MGMGEGGDSMDQATQDEEGMGGEGAPSVASEGVGEEGGGTQVDEVEEVEEVVEEEELEMVDVVRDVLAIKVRCSMHSLASVRRTAVQSCSVLAPVARGMHW